MQRGHCGGLADGIAINYNFDAPIALTAFRRVVRRYGHRLAETLGARRRQRNALIAEKIAYRGRALLREPLIEIVAADAIGMPFDLQGELGVREQNSRDL